MPFQVADSYQGGVGHGGAGRADVRARVAIQGTNLLALTAGETFRIPLSRCSLSRQGRRIVARDEQGSLTIWSDDETFLEALGRAQRGTLQEQVEDIRRAARRRTLLGWLSLAVMVAGILGAANVPLTRWAVRGGVPMIANRAGESALERLALPAGIAPVVESELGAMAERLRPTAPASIRSFRLLLADYAQVHSFGVPPSTVIVTSGLVCAAEGPDPVTAAVARELAHLEGGDVRHQVADTVDWSTAVDLVRGDLTKLRAHMLDFADPKRSPGFTPEQESAADERASTMLARAGISPNAGKELAALSARPQRSPPAPTAVATATARRAPGATRPAASDEVPVLPGAVDWSKVRAEACDLIGR